MEHGLIKTAIEAGLSIGIFGLCVWLVVTIVKRLCSAMDLVVEKMNRFTDRVRDEHGQLTKQHEGIMEGLNKLNGRK